MSHGHSGNAALKPSEYMDDKQTHENTAAVDVGSGDGFGEITLVCPDCGARQRAIRSSTDHPTAMTCEDAET